jgi:methionyl-tRNA formyltransferase
MNIKNVLVISDNPYMCKSLHEIVFNTEDLKASFDYAISPSSDESLFLPLKVKKINLRSDFEVTEIIHTYSLVISIHCKQLFPNRLVDSVRCINVHPGYNPINRGWYPQVFAIIHDLPIGATIHEIDYEIDHGKIIARKFVEKSVCDTSLTLYNKILEAEINLLLSNIKSIIDGSYSPIDPESEGNVYLKKDFLELCEIDLNEDTTYRECINRLRALSHGEYLNAYFKDERSGERIYVKIEFSRQV